MKINIREPAGRERKLWKYTNVRLTGSDLYYPNVLLHTDDTLLFPICETTMSLQTGNLYKDSEFSIPEVAITQEETTPVFFFIYNTDNYFHFLYDALPILQQYDSSMKLLVHPKHEYPFFEDCLSLIGISKDKLVYATDFTLYHTVYVASSPTHEGMPNDPPRNDIWEFYERMKINAYKDRIPTPPKFYVSRRSWIHGNTTNIGTNYTTRRKLMVEDQLVNELEKKGYKEVFCELLTMKEKIQYFGNATHIVGAIGGGMCNLVFSKPSCYVYSIHSPEFDTINRRFLFTMQHTQLKTYTNTYPVSSLYRRIKLPEGFGEIIRREGNRIWAHVNKEGVTFQQEDSFPIVECDIDSVSFLDKGLNSPWSFDVNDFIKSIESIGLLFFHQGWTDIVNCLPLINVYAKRCKRLYVLLREDSAPMIKQYIQPINNVVPVFKKKESIEDKRFWSSQIDFLKPIITDYYLIGESDKDRHDDDPYKGLYANRTVTRPFERMFYEYYGVPYSHRIDSFHLKRDFSLEEETYKRIVKKESYICVHTNSELGSINIPHYENTDIIELNDISYIFFDMIRVLENAKEIHLIDSIWATLCYILDCRYQIFQKIPIYVYCLRNHDSMFTEPKTLPNWTVITTQ
jgi:hypothetical protein